MARILFIRHGQASFFKDNYDQLSPKGIQQAQALHKYFTSQQFSFSRGITGTLQRQIDTFAHMSGEKNQHPPHEIRANFDEHQGPQIVKSLWPEAVPQNLSSEEKKHYMKKYFRFFENTLRDWVLGNIEEDKLTSYESWATFKDRVLMGINQVLDQCQKGENLTVVSSGGPVAVAVGYALNLSDEKTIELSWNIANSSITEFLYSNGRFSLNTFNTTPHLVGAELHSLV